MAYNGGFGGTKDRLGGTLKLPVPHVVLGGACWLGLCHACVVVLGHPVKGIKGGRLWTTGSHDGLGLIQVLDRITKLICERYSRIRNDVLSRMTGG